MEERRLDLQAFQAENQRELQEARGELWAGHFPAAGRWILSCFFKALSEVLANSRILHCIITYMLGTYWVYFTHSYLFHVYRSYVILKPSLSNLTMMWRTSGEWSYVKNRVYTKSRKIFWVECKEIRESEDALQQELKRKKLEVAKFLSGFTTTVPLPVEIPRAVETSLEEEEDPKEEEDSEEEEEDSDEFPIDIPRGRPRANDITENNIENLATQLLEALASIAGQGSQQPSGIRGVIEQFK
ncbi:hypothetical protein FNV43_RR11061 [Rhamnella rubrinervis]|uniref:Uncharacterized protein n=1 Tax=Rhamnella rubrinervis TaxID=2594499 RepID=A0A8K0H599_9ROSA|nr:hypothetical protein FNV43_RR11061 [Rhamnella rubrinervis]